MLKSNYWRTLVEMQRLYINILAKRHKILSCDRFGNTITICSSTFFSPNPITLDRLEYKLEPVRMSVKL